MYDVRSQKGKQLSFSCKKALFTIFKNIFLYICLLVCFSNQLWAQNDSFFLNLSIFSKPNNEKLNNCIVYIEHPDKRTDSFNSESSNSITTWLSKKHTYIIDCYKKGFLGTTTLILSGICVNRLDTSLIMDRIADESWEPDLLFFDSRSFELRPESKQNINSIITVMTDNPQLIIMLNGHTDCRGSKKYNQTLSLKRVESVKQYMVEKGIKECRIIMKAYGESQLVNHCDCKLLLHFFRYGFSCICKKEEHQQNRRVVYWFTSNAGCE
jgi:outer membrane protein OmpA-like peptidoglycan-associated protein